MYVISSQHRDIFAEDNLLMKKLYSLRRVIPARYQYEGIGINYVMSRNKYNSFAVYPNVASGSYSYNKYKFRLCEELMNKVKTNVYTDFTSIRTDMSCPTDIMMLPEISADRARMRKGLSELRYKNVYNYVLDNILKRLEDAPVVNVRLNTESACGGPSHSFDYRAKTDMLEDLRNRKTYMSEVLDLCKQGHMEALARRTGHLPHTTLITRKHSKPNVIENGALRSKKKKKTVGPLELKNIREETLEVDTTHKDPKMRSISCAEVTRQAYAPSIMFNLLLQLDAQRYIRAMGKWPVFNYIGPDDVAQRINEWSRRYYGHTIAAFDMAGQGDSHHPIIIEKVLNISRYERVRLASLLAAGAPTIVGNFARDFRDSTLIIGDFSFDENSYKGRTFQSGHAYVTVLNWISALVDVCTSLSVYRFPEVRKELDLDKNPQLRDRVDNLIENIINQKDCDIIVFLKGDDQICCTSVQASDFILNYSKYSNYIITEEKNLRFLGYYYTIVKSMPLQIETRMCNARFIELRLCPERDIKFKTAPFSGLKINFQNLYHYNKEIDIVKYYMSILSDLDGNNVFNLLHQLEFSNTVNMNLRKLSDDAYDLIQSGSLTIQDIEVLNDPSKIYYKYNADDINPEILSLVYKTIEPYIIEEVFNGS